MNPNNYVLPQNRQLNINLLYSSIKGIQDSSTQTYNKILALEQDIFEQKNYIKNLRKSDPVAQELLKILEQQLKSENAIFIHLKNMIVLYREELEAEFAYSIKQQSEESQRPNQNF